MKSWLRTVVTFVYTAIVCGLFLLASAFVLPKLIVRAEGFWKVTASIAGILIFFGWLSERGVEYASIPYNFLWDKTKKTRLATAIPSLMLGLCGLVLPFLFPYNFSFGDWMIVGVWELIAIFFFYNMFTLPFINPEMGIKPKINPDVGVKPKINPLKRLLLSVPFLRHKMADNTVTSSDGENISICNKMLTMKIAPLLVEEINAGKMEIDVLSSKEYFRSFLSHLFGKKSKVFLDKMRIERISIDTPPGVVVWLMETPSNGTIGQSAFIGFVLSKHKGLSAYTWEHSVNGSKAVCEWFDKTHYYYGNAENINQFIKEIVELKTE